MPRAHRPAIARRRACWTTLPSTPNALGPSSGRRRAPVGGMVASTRTRPGSVRIGSATLARPSAGGSAAPASVRSRSRSERVCAAVALEPAPGRAAPPPMAARWRFSDGAAGPDGRSPPSASARLAKIGARRARSSRRRRHRRGPCGSSHLCSLNHCRAPSRGGSRNRGRLAATNRKSRNQASRVE